MTAAPVLSAPEPKRGPKHAAPKPARKFGLTRKSTKPVRQGRTKARPRTIASVRYTPTGRAMFTVDEAGVATPTFLSVTQGHVSSFAITTGESIAAANSGHWLLDIFETDEQRHARVNAAAVGTVLALVGRLVARV